jgi:RHS repeat-associated protein
MPDSVKGGTTLFSAGYARDAANQLASDTSAASGTGFYKYTPLNQLCYAGSSSSNACTSPPTGSIPYTYDAADNLTKKGTVFQAFNNADELCWTASTSSACSTPPTGATTYQYDTRGNRTNVTPSGSQAQTLTFDQANRMTKYAAASTTSYGYNGDGLRMCKYVGSSNQPCSAIGATQYLWGVAGSLPVPIKDGSTNYVYGPGGLPLEQINTSATYWYHHDQIGSTRLITNSTATAPHPASYTYDPYGGLASISESITNPFRFASQYQDSESGYYYLRARYYEPTTGQFLSLDARVGATREPFGYVGSNPLNSTDVTGLSAVCADEGCGGMCTAFSRCTQPGAQYSGQAWSVINDIVGSGLEACGEAADAFKRAASGFSNDLRGGGSLGGRWLRPAARLSRAFEDIPGIGIASIGASVIFGALAGESPEEIIGGTIGGVIGGAFGAAVIGGAGCALGTLTGPGEPIVCGASLIVGAAIGGYFGGLAGGWLGRSVHQGSWAPWSWT